MKTTTSPLPSPLTPASFYILLALAMHEQHGYGIMKQTELDSSGALRLGPGTLYGTIKRLLEQAWIEEADERPDPALDDQRRRYYRITAAGRQALNLELERLDRAVTLARKHHLLPGHKFESTLA